MSDRDIVAAAGIKTAIIVDDGYDPVPRANELRDVNWDIFFDDAIGGTAERIAVSYPKFDPDERETLRHDDAFVAALWKDREALDDLVSDLFDQYISATARNRRALGEVEKVLSDLGIDFATVGRNFVAAAADKDLIVIDLFLGAAQAKEDRQRTVAGLQEIIEKRDNPPAVVLMSQINLAQKAPELRDEVGLHASGFRSVQKTALSKGACLRRMIVTLAAHRADSMLLAGFTKRWGDGAHQAVDRSVKELRRIDIDDLHHIKTLLLTAEGLLPSSYMLNVLDRVLQYEIEADDAILSGAEALDEVSDKPAPLTIAHGKDSFRLIERTVYINPRRRERENGSVWPITFGDILMSRSPTVVSKTSLFQGDPNRVFFVASPECDLLRGGKKLRAALLIAGTLKPLEMAATLFGEDGTTPIISRGKKRYQIEWEFGHPETITLQRAKNHLAATGPAIIAETLRDVSALNLRQQFLDHLGRVGMLALPPRTFRIAVQCAYPNVGGGLTPLKIGNETQLRGAMHVDQRTKAARIAFDQAQEDDLADALIAIDLAKVANNSRARIESLREQSQAQQLFRTGLHGLKYPLKDSQDVKLLAPGSEAFAAQDQTTKVVGRLFNRESAHPTGNGLANFGIIFTLMSGEA